MRGCRPYPPDIIDIHLLDVAVERPKRDLRLARPKRLALALRGTGKTEPAEENEEHCGQMDLRSHGHHLADRLTACETPADRFSPGEVGVRDEKPAALSDGLLRPNAYP
jgi:hypothetical protein